MGTVLIDTSVIIGVMRQHDNAIDLARQDGLLKGHAGEIWRKKWLLQHEGVLSKELFV